MRLYSQELIKIVCIIYINNYHTFVQYKLKHNLVQNIVSFTSPKQV